MSNDLYTQKRKLSPGHSVVKPDDKKLKMENKKLDSILNSVDQLTKLVTQVVADITQIKTTMIKLQTDMSEMNNRITSTEEKLTTAQNDITNINNRVSELETNKNTLMVSQQNQISIINAFEQMKMATSIMIRNIPQEVELDQALNSISKWSDVDLSKKSLKNARFMKQHKNQCIFMDFWHEKDKANFNKRIKSKQKLPDGTYTPILCENIFRLDNQSINRGVELLFRQPMTEMNRRIFNEARKHRDIFKFVWIGVNGHVMVKRNEGSSPICINSEDHLATVIDLIVNPISAKK